MEPVLEVRDVHKRFGTTAAVEVVSLSVQHGEVFTLLGPMSGADYFDVYEYKYVMEQRAPIVKYYATLKGS